MSGRHRTLSTLGATGDPVDIWTARHQLTLYPEPGPLFETFERLIASASRRVWLETYIYRDDALGGPFADLLVSAARRGLDVRLLYDPQGSQEARRSFFDGLAARGVLVRAYRPWRLTWKRWTYWPRDHGRILIVDDIAHTGGINWGMEWLPRAKGGGEWHDVSLGVRGPAVKDFAFVFSCRWAEASERDEIADYAGTDEADVQFVADSPAHSSMILQFLCAAVRGATRRVWLENSYCVPPRVLLSALSDAAQRGVDVHILVPGQSDLPIIQAASRGEYLSWMRSGLRVSEYQSRVMHSKFAVIDEDWATVGTFNAMSPGVWWANETNVIVRDRGFVLQLAHVFERDSADSVPVTPEQLARRPRSARLWERFVAIAYRLLESLIRDAARQKKARRK